MTGFAEEASTAASTEWTTPPELFDALDKEFGPFTCDPACRPDQYTAATVLGRDGLVCLPPDVEEWAYDSPHGRAVIDGLLASWSGVVYLNPPYGRGMKAWVEKAIAELEAGHCERVVALLPARTDTKMWQEFVISQVDCGDHSGKYASDFHPMLRLVRFLPGRLKFGGHTDPAKFPSAVVVWER